MIKMMKIVRLFILVLAGLPYASPLAIPSGSWADAAPPSGGKVVWDLEKAYREKTPTRERVCLNGLWRWQPGEGVTGALPNGQWGYFKVPGSWPGITNYLQKDSQTVHTHPSWKEKTFGRITAAWYQREISIPGEWAGRRIAVYAEYLNSYAAVYVDGRKAGEVRFPGGELDLTSVCRPGGKHVLSILVVAMPRKGVMLSYNDSASAREVKGAVGRRGLCGDVYLVSMPSGGRIADLKVDTSVRRGKITFDCAIQGLDGGGKYALRARIMENGRAVREFTSKAFKRDDLEGGRMAFTEKWKPEKLWDHGLDEQEANAFLPQKVHMRKEEHISAYFEPPGKNSPLAGIGPADVHNRDPREIFLVKEGASVIGNGVLARAEGADVVFCQLVPWQFEHKKQQNLKRTYRRASFALFRLLANAGVSGSTPVLPHFHKPVGIMLEKRWLESLYLDIRKNGMIPTASSVGEQEKEHFLSPSSIEQSVTYPKAHFSLSLCSLSNRWVYRVRLL